MARKKEVDLSEGPVPGTVEWERQQFLEREKVEYEKRTGETVVYSPEVPITSTPIGDEPAETAKAEGEGND